MTNEYDYDVEIDPLDQRTIEEYNISAQEYLKWIIPYTFGYYGAKVDEGTIFYGDACNCREWNHNFLISLSIKVKKELNSLKKLRQEFPIDKGSKTLLCYKSQIIAEKNRNLANRLKTLLPIIVNYNIIGLDNEITRVT